MLTTETRFRAPEREQLLARVEGLRELLTARARDAEEERTLPRDCVEAMRGAGLFSIAAPRDVGGLEVDPLTQMEVIEALAGIDASAGWTLMIGSHGTQVIGAFASDAACERVFGGPRWPIAGSQISPLGGVYERVLGGYRITGRWSFASGIHHCDWSMLTATERGAAPAGPSTQIAAALPASQVTLHDTWHVAGLKGTGSCDYSVQDVFVADEMVWNYPPTKLRGGPRYSFKGPLLPQAMLASFALGTARRSLEEVTRQAKSKHRPGSTKAVAARPYFQHRLGEATMRLRGARAGLFTLVGDMWSTVLDGAVPPEEQNKLLSASPAYAFDVARDVTGMALLFGGSGASYLDNVLQRNFRDVAVGGQHFQAGEQAYEALGLELLGLGS